MIDRSRITGLVLAGGRGTRMGSVDKGLELFDGRPLVSHALTRLATEVGTLLISANRHRDRYEALGRDDDAAVIADRFADHAGPLAGLEAGLAACSTDYLVAVPCDAPFFPLDLVSCLARAFDEDDVIDVAVAHTAVRTHPVFCMTRRDVAPALARHIADGGRRMHGWLATMRVRPVSFADESAFRNLNTIDELRAAEVRR